MKMSKKLILIFSLLTLITVIINSVCFFFIDKRALEDEMASGLTALGNKMLEQIERYVQMMDYTLENLIANTDFMNAMNIVSRFQPRDGADPIEYLLAQNTLSHVLYRDPLNKNFYRVNVMTREGLFLTSRFDNRDTVNSLTHDIKEITASVHWLNIADNNTFVRHLIPPYRDPWTATRDEYVFSAVRSIVWLGRHVGYFEVQGVASDLTAIFTAVDMDGVKVQALMDNGDILYADTGVVSDYDALWKPDANLPALFDNWSMGIHRLIMPFRSEKLGITIYVEQDLAVRDLSIKWLIIRFTVISLIVLVISIILIAVMSLRLTGSIRRFTQKVRLLPAEAILADPNAFGHKSMVVSRRDAEIYELEEVFNSLMLHLRASIQNEVSARELHLQAQLNALQVQINPHFIYNTLNIISAKGMECDNHEIIEICEQFAQMLRYSTDLRDKTATLEEELHHVQNYLILAKARYEERLSYEINVPFPPESFILPRLSLQPLVENALMHGFNNVTHPMKIMIEGKLVAGNLCLVIRDNGEGFSDEILSGLRELITCVQSGCVFNENETKNGVGLVNTYARLFYHSGKKMKLNIYNDSGAVVEIIMPERG